MWKMRIRFSSSFKLRLVFTTAVVFVLCSIWYLEKAWISQLPSVIESEAQLPFASEVISEPPIEVKPNKTERYALPETCDYRPNRVNPNNNLSKFNCPIPFTMDNDIPFTWGPTPTYSSRTCDKNDHCEYRNVCYDPSIKAMTFFQRPEDHTPETDFGFLIYKEGEAKRRTFSWHFQTKVKSVSPNVTAKWVSGTSLWFDQSYQSICHQGHSSEFYSKVIDIREKFPGNIDRIIYHLLGSGSKNFCSRTCNLMRLGFEDRNWTFPPIYIGPSNSGLLTLRNNMTCFERILVPSYTLQHFTSKASAEKHRRAALKMCNITERTTIPSKPKNVFFLERAANRQIKNSPQLCSAVKQLGYNAYLETDDLHDWCQFVYDVYMADIIISVDGSHNQILSYLRPGTVVIIVFPYHFRVPDWKLLSYFAGARTLELMTLDPALSIGTSSINHTDQSMLECLKYKNRMAIQARSTIVPLPTLQAFLKRANEIWNQKTYEMCELPMEWPIFFPSREMPKGKDFGIYSAYGYQNNWRVCEPPAPDCICCRDPDCIRSTNLERGF